MGRSCGNPNRPSQRWRRQHTSRKPGRPWDGTTKIKHQRWCDALRHARGMTEWRPAVPMSVYVCRWADLLDDGETAEPHWHVGRKPAPKA